MVGIKKARKKAEIMLEWLLQTEEGLFKILTPQKVTSFYVMTMFVTSNPTVCSGEKHKVCKLN